VIAVMCTVKQVAKESQELMARALEEVCDGDCLNHQPTLLIG